MRGTEALEGPGGEHARLDVDMGDGGGVVEERVPCMMRERFLFDGRLVDGELGPLGGTIIGAGGDGDVTDGRAEVVWAHMCVGLGGDPLGVSAHQARAEPDHHDQGE